jgi:Tfp pilus assembly protein PilF
MDAWDRLGPEQRSNIDLLPHEQARTIAEASGAGHFLTGAITRSGDSLGVSLVLHSTRGDSVVGRETAFGPVANEAVSQLGLQATVGILPQIIDPGREVDLTALMARNPAAIVHWVHGEREYRLSHFERALGFYERAIEEDSLLALAALKGGQAASWVKDSDRAGRLLDLSVRHADRMPLRHQHLARGLRHFNASEADSAEHYLRLAMAEDQEWSEAWMALAEVHHHLFPSSLVVDSSDIAGFLRSLELDPGFHPPLIHLAEDAIRKGRLQEAEAYVQTMEEGETDTSHALKFSLMLQCVAEGPARVAWDDAAAVDNGLILDTGLALAAAGYQAPCAKAAFRALLARDSVAENLAWGAMLGLQGILVAEGRYPEALAVLDSALAHGHGEAQFHLVLNVLAGAPWEERAEEIQAYAQGRFGDEYRGMRPTPLWLMGGWHASRGEADMLAAALQELRRRAGGGDARAPTLVRALEGQTLLLAGDTAGAIAALSRVLPTAARIDLGWNVADPLPVRHLTLARIFLATGRHEEALRVASIFDHAQPIVFLPFLPRSLEIRLQAARALGRTHEAQRYEQRLLTLGHPVDRVVP